MKKIQRILAITIVVLICVFLIMFVLSKIEKRKDRKNGLDLVPVEQTGGTSTTTDSQGNIVTIKNGTSTPASTCSSFGTPQKSTISYKTVSGVDQNFLNLDIYYPAVSSNCKNLPIMVYTHGGGWQKGDKANSIQDKVNYFTSQGFVFVSTNYRLTPDVMYPVHNQDVAAAISWVSKNATSYGGNGAKVSVMGHSAGGSIISSVATDESYLNNVGVSRTALRCAVALDTAGYDMQKQVDGDKAIYVNAFGTDPKVLADASPVNHVESGKYIPSFFIVTRGTAIRVSDATTFSDLLKDAGIYSYLLQTQSLDHNGVNAAVGKPGDTLITPSLTNFLPKCK